MAACNNPSETIIAKRRGYGTIVSHNVPPYGRRAPLLKIILCKINICGKFIFIFERMCKSKLSVVFNWPIPLPCVVLTSHFNEINILSEYLILSLFLMHVLADALLHR